MQEYEVTTAGKTNKLDLPFFVMATQNPIEQEGTYPLPEAQLDRFMLSINIGYPTRSEEREIVMATTQTTKKEINAVLQGRDILWIQHLVRQVPTSQHMVDYAVDLVRATRPKESDSPDFIKNWLAWGAGPRAAQNIVLGSKARAILHGRFAVTAEDVRAIVYPVLRHRLFTNFNADAEGVDVDQVIDKLLKTIPQPTYGEAGVQQRVKSVAGPAGEVTSPSLTGPRAVAPVQSTPATARPVSPTLATPAGSPVPVARPGQASPVSPPPQHGGTPVAPRPVTPTPPPQGGPTPPPGPAQPPGGAPPQQR